MAFARFAPFLCERRGAIGHQPARIEKVLNHSSGSFAGIVGVYQKHSFADEKRQALEAWGNFVTTLVEGKPTSKIVRLRGKRS